MPVLTGYVTTGSNAASAQQHGRGRNPVAQVIHIEVVTQSVARRRQCRRIRARTGLGAVGVVDIRRLQDAVAERLQPDVRIDRGIADVGDADVILDQIAGTKSQSENLVFGMIRIERRDGEVRIQWRAGDRRRAAEQGQWRNLALSDQTIGSLDRRTARQQSLDGRRVRGLIEIGGGGARGAVGVCHRRAGSS